MKTKPIAPIHFLDISKELIKKKSSFGSNIAVIERTIADRSYYAAFLYLREWIKNNIDNHSLTYNADDHKTVILEIEDSDKVDDNTYFRISSNLKSLRWIRNDASYELEGNFQSKIDELTIQDIVDDSEAIFNHIDNISKIT